MTEQNDGSRFIDDSDYEEYTPIEGVAFEFDPDRQIFILRTDKSTKIIDPSREGEVTDFFDTHGGIHTEGLVTTPLGIVETSNLRVDIAFLAQDEERLRNAEKTVAGVIKRVFRQLAPEIELEDDDSDINPNVFSAVIYPNGLFKLTTLGTCSCLSPDPNSPAVIYDIDQNWEENLSDPIAYSFHNNDISPQTTSLLAGAGTIAWIAGGKTSDQLNLGLVKD